MSLKPCKMGLDRLLAWILLSGVEDRDILSTRAYYMEHLWKLRSG
jgi:hypothetical protein